MVEKTLFILEKIDPSVKRVVLYFIYEKWPEIKQVYWFYGFLSSKETFFLLHFLFKWFCQNILGIQNTTLNNLTFRHGNTLESTYTQHCFVMFGQNIYISHENINIYAQKACPNSITNFIDIAIELKTASRQ